jgi:hypothetical protein
MSRSLSLQVLGSELAIVRLSADAGLPWWAVGSEEFLSFTRSVSETSVVCEADRVPEGVRAERGYRALRVEGTLPFEAVGVLASIAVPLAHANTPIFVISTFDTDYVLVREAMLPAAVQALREAGHSVTE